MQPKSVPFFTFFAAFLVLLACSCGSRPTGPNVIDDDAPKEFTKTDSGLQYRILRKSDGPKPLPHHRVEVDYTGWLEDGTVFDTSYERKDPAEFTLSGVVPGWTEGLQFLGEGGMIELIIPSELGYGARGKPPTIPPDATLRFKVELHKIKQ